MNIVLRGKAKELGLVKYFTGKPCKCGHISERRTTNGLCIECERSLNAGYARVSRANPAKREKRNKAVRECVAKIHSDLARSKLFRKKKAEWQKQNNALPATKERKRRLARARYKDDPARDIARVHKRRALKLRNGGTFTSQDVEEIYQAQHGKCAYCRVELSKSTMKYHVDHVVPLVRGGWNNKRNLQLLCGPCNQSKGAHDPIEFVRDKFGLLV
jgi:5-methylcytosine-specific restriction endonuclease McrA